MSEAARKFLQCLQRFDLAMLLSVCEMSLADEDGNNLWERHASTKEVVVHAPPPVDEALRSLSQYDRKRITEAVCSAMPAARAHDDIRVESRPGPAEGAVALLSELLIHQAMMADVATGGDRIPDVNDYYVAREARIRSALPPGMPYANPHADLWDWYRHWRGRSSSRSRRRCTTRGSTSRSTE